MNSDCVPVLGVLTVYAENGNLLDLNHLFDPHH